ncbi:MAG: hypothetical protein EKK41_14130 [Hyphomicrobiales bacterium]|nr:MAG: hypothetical protein EKK41_14130 [Hyphomicrobiales bacterium]
MAQLGGQSCPLRAEVGMRRLVNAAELRDALRGQNQNKDYAKIMLQSLFRALQNETHCMEELKEYPMDGIPRVSREEFHAKGPFFRYVPSEEALATISVVGAWAREAVARRERWIREVDDNGRITRLLGLKRVHDVLAVALDELKRYEHLDRNRATWAQERAQVAQVLALPDGRSWVQLLTLAAFHKEAADMRHCIADEPYYRNHVLGYAQYYSLRDGRGRARVTVEVRQGLLMQAKSAANGDPWPKWKPEIEALLAHMGWRLAPQADTVGFVRPRSMLHGFRIVPGDLDLSAGPQPAPLATRLQVCGSLIAQSKDWLTSLPDTLWVEGDCLVEKCRNLIGAPRLLLVHGRASFAGTVGLRGAFERILVWGDLDLSHCTALSELPDKIHVGGTLDITGSGLRHLPPTLSVGDRIVCGRLAARSAAEMNMLLAEETFKSDGQRRH